MTPRSRNLISLAVAVAAGGLAGFWFTHQPPPKPVAAAAPECERTLTKAELEKSIELGTHFMIAHQKPAGNFDYEYDWKTKRNSSDDNAARQSGALWGLGLLHGFGGPPKSSPELDAALVKGIAYFDDASVAPRKGWRYPVYRGEGATAKETNGGVGMVSLVALAMTEYARSLPPDSPERARWTARANEYVDFVAGLLLANGTWPGEYRYDTGAGVGEHSPYSDGEALLCLVTAMKYLGRADLRPTVERAAVVGHRINVDEALAKESDSDTTKGYYQWSSMAYYELATSSPPGQPYGDWLLSLADWVLDVHKVLGRPRNTGYAYEGIVSAYAWAHATKDPRADKYACAIHRGLATLLGWQVGHPRAAALGSTDDPKAIGGVQNHAVEPSLRIDTVQHQLHATMLAHDLLF